MIAKKVNKHLKYSIYKKKCKQCGKTYFVEKFRRKSKYCSVLCRCNSRPMKICVCLNCLIEFANSNNNRKYCSRKCHFEYVKKHGLRKGKNNPSFGIKKSKQQLLKMKEVGKMCAKNKKWRDGVSTSWFNKDSIPWNKNKYVRLSKKTEFKKGRKESVEEREKRSVSLRKVWTNKEYKLKRIKKMHKWFRKQQNIPERSLENVLKILFKNNYKFVGDGKVTVSVFCPDFINKKDNKIIEMYGDYWHNRPDIKERDKRRIKSYKKHGYKLLVVWEHELQDLDLLAGKLRYYDDI